MRKRLDFTRENRPYCYFQRVAILHQEEALVFPVDRRYNFVLRAVYEKHNAWSAYCPQNENFLPGAVNVPLSQISLAGNWPVGKSVAFTSTGAVPPPIVPNQVYFVRSFVLGPPNIITLSATYGGPLFVLAGAGAGVHTIHAARSPEIGIRIDRVSTGLGEFYAPVFPGFFATPGPENAGVYQEAAPFDLRAFSVNFTATPRMLAKPINSLFYSSDVMHVKISGQTINSATQPEDNLPSYLDLMLAGRHYPESSMPLWARRGKK